MPSHFLVVPVAILLLFVAYLLHPLVWLIASLCLSPLARLPSPPSPSLLLGNLAAIADQENNDVVTSWTRTYGSTFTYRGFIGGRRLLTTDPAALNHILGHAYDFPKPEFVRASLAAMVAGDDGLLTVEGATHRRQRKILNQAFTTPHIRSLYPIFITKAIELRDLILGAVDAPSDAPPPSPSLVAKSSQSPVMDSFAILRSLDPIRPKSTTDVAGSDVSASSGIVVDVLSYFARATLDVIGLAGFGYTFNALASPHSDGPDGVPAPDNELSAAFATIFATARKFRVLNVFQSWFPPLRRYQPNGASIKEAQATIRRVGSALIDDRLGEKGLLCPDDHPRDLLSVLVRANDAAGAGALSHEEVISQISTFLAAGHETSASALTWTLYALARAPHEQNTLREALLKLPNDVSSDDLLALPELDHVIRESLRLHAPVSSTMRVYAGEAVETVIPLSRGVRVRAPSLMETWRVPVALTTSLLLGITLGRTWALAAIICVTLFEIISKRRRKDSSEFALGEWIEQDHIRLRRGDIITIPIQAVNRDPEVWGEDAREFRPSRWKEPPPAATSVNGLYPRTLTFLNGSPIHGNRACIGYRFAIAEIAIFLSTLLRVLEFSIDDDVRIEKRVNVVTRPFVASTPELGNQMPLRVRRVVHP